MGDPGLRDEMARQRAQEDEIMRRTAPRYGTPVSPRHMRGTLPGGRMYGEDDSVIGYFAGHTWRGVKAVARLIFRRRGHRDEAESAGSIQFRDYDPE